MKYYEKRMQQDEDDICSRMAAVTRLVMEAMKNAVHALLTGDHRLANLTVLGDGEINRVVRSIDHDCHRFIVRHLPSAGHLRLISATIRSAIALERIGDYAVNISRVAARMSAPPPQRLAVAAEHMSAEASEMLGQAMQAFVERNAEKAKAIMLMAHQVERLRAAALRDLAAAREGLPVEDLFAMFVVFGSLERVGDQAKNLCEEAVFAATGQTKPKKIYRILFLDRDNACMAPMAEAIAQQNFPNSGRYEIAALTPVKALAPDMVEFMASRGIDVTGIKTQVLDKGPMELAEYHVVVSLQGPIGNYVHELPFLSQTAVLEWDLPQSPDDAGLDHEALYRAISIQVRELMEQLRGREAD